MRKSQPNPCLWPHMEGCTHPPTHPCRAEGIAHRSARLASLLVRSLVADRSSTRRKRVLAACSLRARCVLAACSLHAFECAASRIASHRIASRRWAEADSSVPSDLPHRRTARVVPGALVAEARSFNEAIDTPVHRTHRLQQARTAAHGFVRSSGRRSLRHGVRSGRAAILRAWQSSGAATGAAAARNGRSPA